MDRAVFFDRVRVAPFRGSLTPEQVSGMEAILDAWVASALEDERWLAYMLATSYHETAHTMQPIEERGGEDYFTRMYDRNGERPHVAARLGNTQGGDGPRFRGRGYVQLTGRANYEKASKVVGADLVGQPEQATEPAIAAKIMFHGMQRGWFTSKKLADYFDGDSEDPVNARKIINGLDRADLIAGYYENFNAALKAAEAGSSGTGARGKHGAVIPSGLNLRAEASTTSEVLQVLKRRDVVGIIGERLVDNTRWLHVNAGGKIGWVAGRFVELGT